MILSFDRGPVGRGWLVAALAVIAATAPVAACSRTGDQPAASQEVTLNGAQAELVLKALADAPSHGFAPGAFPTRGLEDALRSGDPAKAAAAQHQLVAEAIAYARAQHGFAIPRPAMDRNWGMRSQPLYDAAAELRAAVAQDRLEAWLASLPPSAPRYDLLRKGYLTYLKLAQDGGWAAIPAGPPMHPGAQGARVAALRQRLAPEDETISRSPVETPYDGALAQAVARFQARHGLPATGVVDAHTLDALNVPAVVRAAQIRANLERWRWAPRDQPPTRIEVNSAAGTFQLYQDGQPAMHMLAAAGKPGDETPIMASAIHTVVLNPKWNVPESIAGQELFPKERNNPGYFAAHGFRVRDGGKLVQEPGPDNSLGRVKFLFDNDYSIYLHDTPAKAAFSRPQRQVSHGCVRLEKAIDLAKLVLSREAGWSPARVDETLMGSGTVTATLSQSIPVEIFYWTAFVEGDQVSFRNDVYGWDRKILRQLDASLARKA